MWCENMWYWCGEVCGVVLQMYSGVLWCVVWCCRCTMVCCGAGVWCVVVLMGAIHVSCRCVRYMWGADVWCEDSSSRQTAPREHVVWGCTAWMDCIPGPHTHLLPPSCNTRTHARIPQRTKPSAYASHMSPSHTHTHRHISILDHTPSSFPLDRVVNPCVSFLSFPLPFPCFPFLPYILPLLTLSSSPCPSITCLHFPPFHFPFPFSLTSTSLPPSPFPSFLHSILYDTG